jgi:hypothetical protein
VIVAFRGGPVFAVAVKLTEPLPLPDAPLVMVIHGSDVVAVHAHPEAMVTVTAVPAPPATGTVSVVGLIDDAQLPASVTASVWPAMAMLPLRDGPVFAVVVKFTVPLPLPDAPDVIVIHGVVVVAVHAQPDAIVTATGVPAPPPATMFSLAGRMDDAQVPASVIDAGCPATVIVPVRDAPLLAAAEKLTVPFPLPDAPPVIVSHGSVVVAFQAQPAAVVTLTAPGPPAAAIACAPGATEVAHEPVSVTVNIWPAIVAVPVRVAPVLAATAIARGLGPAPAGLPATVSHVTLLAAAHEQVGSVATLRVAMPPPAPNDCAMESSVKTHGTTGTMPEACVT